MIAKTRFLVFLAFLPMIVVPLSDVISSFSPFLPARFFVFFGCCTTVGLLIQSWNGKGPFLILLWSLGLAGIISGLWSEAIHVTLPRALLNLLTFLGLTFLYANLSLDNLLFTRNTFAKLMALILVIFCSIGLLFMGPTAYHGNNFIGPFSNPNSLALLIFVFCTPIGLQAFVKGKRARLLGVSIMIFALLVIYLTRSRAALLAIFTVVFLLSVLQKNLKLRWLAYVTSFIFAWLLGATVYSLFVGKYESISTFGTRAILWSLHIDAILDRPLLGYGLGVNPVNFKNIDNFLYDTEKGSSLITLIEELGLIFSTLFLMYFLHKLASFFWFLKLKMQHSKRIELCISYAVVCGALVHSFFESWIFNFGNPASVMFWLNIAILSKMTVNEKISSQS